MNERSTKVWGAGPRPGRPGGPESSDTKRDGPNTDNPAAHGHSLLVWQGRIATSSDTEAALPPNNYPFPATTNQRQQIDTVAVQLPPAAEGI